MHWFSVTRKHQTNFSLPQMAQALRHPRLPLMVALVAVAVTLPSLWQGLVADDFMHRHLLLTRPLSALLRGMFTFVHPDPMLAPMGLSVEAGSLPWWTVDGLRLAFFRPLSVLTHWLDIRLWPETGAMMHLQSLLWYGGACWLAALIYRRLMGREIAAGLAALLFAVDSLHIGSVAWLANRNILIALAFGLLCLLAHDRWRRDGWRPGAWIGPLMLLLALLAAEASMAIGAYLFAYLLFVDPAPWRQRLAALAPTALTGLLWAIVYKQAGYGSWGSGFYTDPISAPVDFAAAVLERGPVLLLGQWIGQLPAAYNFLSAPAALIFWLLTMLLLAALFVILLSLLRRERTARFWMVGMVLAIVPACSIGVLSGRLLIFASLGAMGLIGAFIPAALDTTDVGPGRRGRMIGRRFAQTMLVLHLILPLLLIPITVRAMDQTQRVIDSVTNAGIENAGPGGLVIVNAPSPFHFIYLPSQRALSGQPIPQPLRILAPGDSAVEITGVNAQTFRVRPVHGYLASPGTGAGNSGGRPPLHVVYMYQYLAEFFRSDTVPMTLGQEVQLNDAHFKIVELTPDGRPWTVEVRFEPAAGAARSWVQWDWQSSRYLPFTPPAAGESAWIAGPW